MSKLSSPSQTSPFVGHREIIEGFSSLIRTKRLPRVLLFYGNHGVGKYGLLQEILRLVLGESSDVNLDVWQAPTDVDILKRVDAEAILAHLRLQPGRGEYRVIIVRDVERCSLTAVNMLLKTFEEPPPKSLIWLTSSRKDALLPTLRSRCLEYYVPPLGKEDFGKILSCELELSGIRDALPKTLGSYEELCAVCGGSVGEAMFYLKNQSFFARLGEFLAQEDLHKALMQAQEILVGVKLSTSRLLYAIELSLNLWYRKGVFDSQLSSRQLQRLKKRRTLLAMYHGKSEGVSFNNQAMLNALAACLVT